MKFIHTSDWHIGRQFHNVSLLEDQQHVLEQILGYIKEENVDAVVIAGDIYDRSVPPAVAVELLDEVFNTICSTGVQLLLIPGNHDSAERLGFASRQLRQAGVHIFGNFNQMTDPVLVKGAEASVYFYGIPYNDPTQVRNHYEADVSSYDEANDYLLEQINAVRDKDAINVLISHCFIDGADESESERPLSIGGADRVSYQSFADFDYVALGHLHSPQYKGGKHIRYSGSILKYSFSEQKQNKGITLVEMNASGVKAIKNLPLNPLRDLRIIEGELHKIIEAGKVDPGADDYLLIRLTDTHAILDPMGKLRTVYPNVLHLEKPGMLINVDQKISRDRLKRGELEMFRDFFKQVHGQPLSKDQDAAVIAAIDEVKAAQGETA
ncbi:MAG: exonuclease SbcCD subunit D [Proteobacteria bacterium]|nr:exonuclease SbcCD subunit D [Pseudomonadota bacterium]